MTPEIQEALSALLLAVLTLATTAITVVVVPALKRWLQSRYTREQLSEAERIARIAVSATEQVAPRLRLHGAAKLSEARGHLRGLARTYGVVIPEDEIDTLLEDAVRTWLRDLSTVTREEQV